MIDPDVKLKLLTELEKSGNVYLACSKTGVGRATYYRWVREDQTFRRTASTALKIGRENLCDIAEHALLLKVKDKDLGAVKYVLSHNSSRYKPKKQSKVILEHRSISGESKPSSPDNLTDWIKRTLKIEKDQSETNLS